MTPSTQIGMSVNWGRSAIEGRDPSLPVRHVRQLRARGLLDGVVFSGAAATHGAYGAPLVRRAPADAPWPIPESLIDVGCGRPHDGGRLRLPRTRRDQGRCTSPVTPCHGTSAGPPRPRRRAPELRRRCRPLTIDPGPEASEARACARRHPPTGAAASSGTSTAEKIARKRALHVRSFPAEVTGGQGSSAPWPDTDACSAPGLRSVASGDVPPLSARPRVVRGATQPNRPTTRMATTVHAPTPAPTRCAATMLRSLPGEAPALRRARGVEPPAMREIAAEALLDSTRSACRPSGHQPR